MQLIKRIRFIFLPLVILCFSPVWAEEFKVGMRDWMFHPEVLTIKTGDTVILINDDDSHHTVTFEDATIKSSENIKPERQFYITFDKTGEYKYYCKYHRDYNMRGKIIVK